MLNDLIAIERGMTANGVSFVDRDPSIKDMAKGWALRVRIGAGGEIAGVEIVPEAGRGALWTLRDGQHNGFPGLKTPSGLLLLNVEERAAHVRVWEADKTPDGRRKEVLRLLAVYPRDTRQDSIWPNSGHRMRITERLEALHPLAKSALTAAVPAAFERFLLALDATPSFLEGLAATLAERLGDRGDDWIEPVCASLISPIALAIDVAEGDFDRDATDPRQIGPVSVAMSGASDDNGDPILGDAQCALSGRSAKLHTGNFPQPNLPGLGQTYIFSRNKDIPSLTRYARTADASFSIDSDLVRRLSGAITALTREEAKGRSWRLIPAETGDKPDLLVTSIAADPDLELADAVTDDDEGELNGERRWNELGARVIKQSSGISDHGYPQEEVVVLILRTVDPANRKTIYHRNTTSTELWKAAQRWQAATANTPDWLGFRMPVRGTSELVFRRPPYVAPLSITPLSRIQFANGGRRRIAVIGVTAADAFALLLHEGNVEQSARSLLKLLLKRHGALLSGLAAARRKGIEYLKDFDPKTDLRRDALRSTTWTCALLHNLDRSKEVYMSDNAFRLGQLLAAADVIHVAYCADLRGGDVPPSLLGNSVLTVAGSHPKRALAILESRLKPYLAWAKREERLRSKIRDMKTAEPKTEEQKKANRLSWAISDGFYSAPRLRTLVNDLRTVISVDRTDDSFKAELLLGYLAGFPPKKIDKQSNFEDGRSNNRNEGDDA